MPQAVSIHVADLGTTRALRLFTRPARLAATPGLRNCHFAAAAPLRASAAPRLTPRRVALVAFWDADTAARHFIDKADVAAAFRDGWCALLEPLRMFGAWPGLDDLPSNRVTDYDGPAVALTFGRLRLRHTLRFLRVSGHAERAAVQAPGFVWGTAMARPPFVANLLLVGLDRRPRPLRLRRGGPRRSHRC